MANFQSQKQLVLNLHKDVFNWGYEIRNHDNRQSIELMMQSQNIFSLESLIKFKMVFFQVVFQKQQKDNNNGRIKI